MRIKRILFTLLVALMMFSLIAVASFAANGPKPLNVTAEINGSAVSDDVSAVKPGSEIELTIELPENPGISMLQIIINHSEAQMKYKDCANGVLFAEAGDVLNGNGWVQIDFASEAGTSEFGKVVVVKFELVADYHGELDFSVTGTALPISTTLEVPSYEIVATSARTYTVHSYGEPVIVDPTCTANGTVTYTCSGAACTDRVYSYETDMLPHTKAEAVKEKVVEATCTTPGSHDDVIYCTVCDAELERTPVIDSELGHAEVKHDAKDPTCTDFGWDAYVTCSRCDYTTYEEKAALGHDEVKHDAKDPTCTDIGWDAYVTCSRCDYTTYVEKAALGHDEVKHDAKDPTCTDIGWDAYVTCSRCDYTTYVEKAALGHDEVKHDAKDPTCTDIGWDAYVTCSRCDYTTYVEKAALGHDEVKHDAQAPTCTEIGWDAYVTCSRCDYTTYVKKAALGHDYADATCLAPKTCKREGCGVTEGEALGHSFTNFVSNNDATCTADGTETAKCDRCDETKTQTDVDSKLGHNFPVKNYVSDNNATCTEDGTKTATCSRCDATDTVADEGSKLGHSFTNFVSNNDATCTADGTETAKCDRCDETKTQTDVDSKLGHTEVVDAAVAPTTTATGLTEGKHCSVCNEVFVAQTVIKKLPVVVTSPTENWAEGDGDMVFKSDADFADFESVTVNGEVLAKENYTVTEGSTVVTLSEKYLKTLENGTYTICIKSTSGVAESTFTVENSSGWIVAVIIIAAVVVCAGVAVGVVFYKKKKAAN